MASRCSKAVRPESLSDKTNPWYIARLPKGFVAGGNCSVSTIFPSTSETAHKEPFSQRQIKYAFGRHAAAAGRSLRFVDGGRPLHRAALERKGRHGRFAHEQHALVVDAGQIKLVFALLNLPAGHACGEVQAHQHGLFGGSINYVVAGDHRGRRAPLIVERQRRNECEPIPLLSFVGDRRRGAGGA